MRLVRGFTLVEILIVAAIIALMTAMTMPLIASICEQKLVLRGDAGQIDPQDLNTLKEYRRLKKIETAKHAPPGENTIHGYNTFIQDGKTYLLVPQGMIKDAKIDGQPFLLIPSEIVPVSQNKSQ